MFEEFEYEGLWWLPTNPEDQLQGKLKYTFEGGYDLYLLGEFKGLKDEFNSKEITIWGFTKNGNRITLIDCFRTNYNLPLPGIPSVSFAANKVYTNVHFTNEKEYMFNSAELILTNIDEWVEVTGLSAKYVDKKLVIEYLKPNTIEIFEDNQIKINVSFSTKGTRFKYRFEKRIELEQFVKIKIDFMNKAIFDEIFQFSNIITNLFTLIITQPVFIKKMILSNRTDDNKNKTSNNNGSEIECYYLTAYRGRQPKHVEGRNMLFTYKAMPNRIQDIITKWINFYKEADTIINLFFGTLYNEELFTTNKFLNLIHSLESYHRKRLGGLDLSKEDHEKRIAKILENISPEYNEWLNGKLKYSNEISLRKRILEILEKYKSILNPFITDPREFAYKISNTRNYLTHYDTGLKKGSYNEMQLYYASIKLKILMALCLLTEIGFTNEEIEKMITKNKQYSFELRKGDF